MQKSQTYLSFLKKIGMFHKVTLIINLTLILKLLSIIDINQLTLI